jgi:hypothetical protein
MIGEFISRSDPENVTIIRLAIPGAVLTGLSPSRRRPRHGTTSEMALTRLHIYSISMAVD